MAGEGTARRGVNRGRHTAEAAAGHTVAAEAAADLTAVEEAARAEVAVAVAEAAAAAAVVVRAAAVADIPVARTKKALPREATPFRPVDSFSPGHLA